MFSSWSDRPATMVCDSGTFESAKDSFMCKRFQTGAFWKMT